SFLPILSLSKSGRLPLGGEILTFALLTVPTGASSCTVISCSPTVVFRSVVELLALTTLLSVFSLPTGLFNALLGRETLVGLETVFEPLKTDCVGFLKATLSAGLLVVRLTFFSAIEGTSMLSLFLLSSSKLLLSLFSLRSEEHTSELQSRFDLVCRLLLEKKISI